MSAEWQNKLPLDPGYHWARRLTHNGPSGPFIVWCYRVRYLKSKRNHYRMRVSSGAVYGADEVKEHFEISVEPITCPISTRPPSLHWLQQDDGETIRDGSKKDQ